MSSDRYHGVTKVRASIFAAWSGTGSPLRWLNGLERKRRQTGTDVGLSRERTSTAENEIHYRSKQTRS